MRDIKFRAWDEKRKVMFSDKALCLVIHFNGELNHFDTDGEIMGTGNTEQIPLMQYTGIKDKNGKEIYEGDIVLSPQRAIQRVFYSEQFAAFLCEDIYRQNGEIGDTWIVEKEDEVIGNIYENPELLEGGNKNV